MYRIFCAFPVGCDRTTARVAGTETNEVGGRGLGNVPHPPEEQFMRKGLTLALAALLMAAPLASRAQSASGAGEENTRQARVALEAMIGALGGPAWLTMKNQMREERVAAFCLGVPRLARTGPH
jgi:hypothetical protein